MVLDWTCWLCDGADMTSHFEAGRQARLAGKTLSDNPHVIGRTKLGAQKLSEAGIEWEQGFYSVPRAVSAKEAAAARSVDVSRFRRKPNRYYR